MQRIVIIGNGGSGKTTLANKLGEVLEEKVYHLDLLAWEPGWAKRSEKEFTQKLNLILNEQSWIVEGWSYQSTLKRRLEKADVILFLNTPLVTCWLNILRRKFAKKPSVKAYNTPKSKNTLCYIWATYKVHLKYMKELKSALEKHSHQKPVYVFKSAKQKQHFYHQLKYGQRLKEPSNFSSLFLHLQQKLSAYLVFNRTFAV